MKDRGPKVNYCKVIINTLVTDSSHSRRKEDVSYEEFRSSHFSCESVVNADNDNSIKVLRKGSLKVCVLSDSHDEHERVSPLPPCDILVHAGDIFYKSRHLSTSVALEKLKEFNEWLGAQKATYKIVIGGNHDIVLLNLTSPYGPSHQEHIDYIQKNVLTNAIYLCNSSVKLYNDSFTVVGSPMSVGQGSSNLAFQHRNFVSETYAYFRALAADKTRVDLLVTHGPCDDIGSMIQPTVAHVYGHIHEHYGVVKFYKKLDDTTAASSHVLDYRKKLLESLKNGMNADPVQADCENVEMEAVDDNGCPTTATTSVEAAAGQNKFVFWHRVAASIMNEDFCPTQLPMLIEFEASPTSDVS